MHFRLDSDVEKSFVQLLETEQDARRNYRVEGDTFCTMFKQIRNEERKLSLAERRGEC